MPVAATAAHSFDRREHRGGGFYSLTRWSQSSDKVVLIVQQSLFCRTIYTTFQQKYRAVPILPQSGFNSLNGQNLSGNVDHPINQFCYSVLVSFKYISVFLNQYLDVGKRK